MSRKSFVIDTNVLLHDPQAIQRFKDNNVIIPLVVLEELDTMKRLSDELGKNARHVMRYIDSLKNTGEGDLSAGVPIENGIFVKVHIDLKPPEKKMFPLPLDRVTNKILLTAFILKEQGENVVLVSKDFVTRVKAEAIGLEAEDYENLKFSYDKIYRGYRKVEVPKKEIDLFYKDGSISITGKDFSPNEYCVMTSPEQSSAVCKYNSETKKLEPLIRLSRDIWGIHPLNVEQKCALDLLLRDDIKLVTLIGPAGTGKTLLALAAGLKKVFDDNI
ncbi:MAG: PhoH family protein, partial [Rhabdochlamydiaceae bacterium]